MKNALTNMVTDIKKKKLNENLRLSDLVQISNNSMITNQVLAMLNSALDEGELIIFKRWLQIVRDNK
jgi:hypothetical protein